MTVVQFKNSTGQMTLQDAVELYEVGICTIITDGRDVTFMAEEKEPTSRQTK